MMACNDVFKNNEIIPHHSGNSEEGEDHAVLNSEAVEDNNI